MMDSCTQLGKLERVDLRKVWVSEAGSFTPWLATEQNVALLGDAIGMELEVQAREKDVGPFRADILCKDTATDNLVLVENQLERTDHCHLGQLLTYAAGLHAVTIVWIAERFTDEHRAALDWLNEATRSEISFFGIEVELWRIGNSPPAPKFNVVSRPYGTVPPLPPGLTEIKKLQLEYWTQFAELVKSASRSIKATKPAPQHWMNIALGTSGVHLAAIASSYDSETGSYNSQEVRAEVVLHGEQAKVYYAALEAQRTAIEREFGEPLIWHNPQDKQMCRIWVRRKCDLKNRDQWPDQQKWLLEKLERLHAVFGARVRQLKQRIDADEPTE